MLVDYFRQGVKNLRQKRLRSMLTMVGIFIGVALVVALLSLGQGLQDAVIGQFAGLGANTITVQAKGGGFGPPGSFQSVTIGEDDLEVVRRTQGVDEAFGRLIEPVRVVVDDKQQFGYIATIDDSPEGYDLSLVIPTVLVAEQGRLVRPRDTHKVNIGAQLAEKPVFERELRVGDKLFINDKRFEVVGVLEKTGNPQLDTVIWMMTEAARDVTGKEESFGLIAARIEDNAEMDEVKAAIEKELRRSRDVKLGKEDFVVESSQETIDSLNSVLGVVKWFLVGIASISIMVGGVGITNTMYTSVLERTREIGIMKAIGAKNSDVLTLFLIESGLLGVLGGMIGIGIGLGMAYGVQAITQASLGTDLIRAHVSFGLLFGAIMGSFVIGAVAGVTPARQASRMKPVEALRYG